METAASESDRRLSGALRARGQRVTSQRLLLHRVLRELDRHVSAEEVLRAADERLPNLSLPTVYATLELFEQLGIVRRVPVGSSAVLYDPRTEEHQHLACRVCGRVVDLDVAVDPAAALAAAAAGGGRGERADV